MALTAPAEPAPRELDDPTDADPPLRVLYDEACPFCRWTAEFLRRADRRRRLRLIPYRRVKDHPELAAAVRGERLGETVHVVDGAGRLARGAEAVLAIVALLPAGAGTAQLVRASPPARAVLAILYAALNRWRGRIASTFGLDGPLLHEPSGD